MSYSIDSGPFTDAIAQLADEMGRQGIHRVEVTLRERLIVSFGRDFELKPDDVAAPINAAGIQVDTTTTTPTGD